MPQHSAVNQSRKYPNRSRPSNRQVRGSSPRREAFWGKIPPVLKVCGEELDSDSQPNVHKQFAHDEDFLRRLNRFFDVNPAQLETFDECGWVVVQPDRYRYAVVETGGVVVRMVLSEYLACEVVWEY